MPGRHFFTYGDFTLEYMVYGHGPRHLLYFHGYGKSASEFADYEMDLAHTCTVYSFSFFHHGQSVYPAHRIDRHTLTEHELADMIAAFLAKKNIERFSLMGYSMGGKICLTLLQYLGQRTDKLILVAPDGMTKNFWYRFTSNNRMGNALYRKIIRQPGFFFLCIKALRKIKLLDPRLYDFVYLHLETEDKRRQVYRVWMTLRNICPDSTRLVRVISERQISTCLHLGRYDRVIPLRHGRKFHSHIRHCARLYVLEKGHKMANAQTGQGIEAFLKEP